MLLLLCGNSHDDQLEEEVQACHNKFNDYVARNQEMIQHIAQPVQPRITQWLKDYEPMRQAVFGNKQWFSIQQSLLSELTRCRVSLQRALQKSSEAQKAAEHALASKSEVESALGDISRKLSGKQRSFEKTKGWAFYLSGLNRDLRSQCKNLEEKLESQKEDLADAKRSEETMSDEIELIRGELQSILSDVPPSMPKCVDLDISSRSTPDLARAAREMCDLMKRTIHIAESDYQKEIMEGEEADDQDLAQGWDSAPKPTKGHFTSKIATVVNDGKKASTEISKLQETVRQLERQRDKTERQIMIKDVRTPC